MFSSRRVARRAAIGIGVVAGLLTMSTTWAAESPASGAAPSTEPQVLGTGPWIVYKVGYQGAKREADLRLIRPDGSEDHRIPGSPGARRFPSWSPDGSRLLFESTPADRDVSEIWVVAPDGTGQERLRTCDGSCYGNGAPAWSPDGSTILYDAAEGPTDAHSGDMCYLATLDLESRAELRILKHPGCDLIDAFPKWSSDGSRIVYQRSQANGGPTAIFEAASDGTDEHQVTEWGSSVHPDQSPDDQWIVTMSSEACDGGPCDDPWASLDIVRPDGTDQHPLTVRHGGWRDLFPRWLPDGSGVTFSRCNADGACDLRVADVDVSDGSVVSERVILADDRHGAMYPAWQPMP